MEGERAQGDLINEHNHPMEGIKDDEARLFKRLDTALSSLLSVTLLGAECWARQSPGLPSSLNPSAAGALSVLL